LQYPVGSAHEVNRFGSGKNIFASSAVQTVGLNFTKSTYKVPDSVLGSHMYMLIPTGPVVRQKPGLSHGSALVKFEQSYKIDSRALE